MSKLAALAATALSRPADLEAVQFDGAWITWGELSRIAAEVTAALALSGVPAEAPVAFIARNRPPALAALLGLIAEGRTIRMLYPFQASAAIARDLGNLDISAVIADEGDFTDEVKSVLAERRVAGLALRADNAFALGVQADPKRMLVASAPLIEILTSGTTGPPKRFPVSYTLVEQHFLSGSALRLQPGADPRQAPPALLYFPLGNITGLYSTLPALIHGVRVVLLSRFSLQAWRDYVVRYRPEHTGVPPSFVQQILDADIPRDDLTSIKAMGVGAATLDPAVQAAFEQRYAIPILISYGATEFGGPVTAMTAELHAAFGDSKLGTVGRPLPGAQVRAVDPQTREPLPANAVGALEIVSPRIGPDWIATSDLGCVDEDGFVFLAGRADGAIMRGGFKILPEVVELALKRHPAVSDAAVVGLPDAKLGQAPAAAVRLRPARTPPSFAELEAHLRATLLATHIPTRWVVVDDLPRTPSLKIDRPGVARLFAAQTADGGA